MKTALALVSDNFEDLELMYPVIRMKEEGIDVVIAGDKVGHTYLGKHGYPCISSAQFQDLEGDQFDGVLIPGGFAPDRLRYNPAVLKLVKTIHTNNCPVAFICHGGWVPISANIVKGKKVTGTIAIKDDFVGETMRRRVQKSGCVMIDTGTYAWPWDGTGIWQTVIIYMP